MFRISVSELRTWMATTLGEMMVASTVKAFLLARGEATMVSCLHGACNYLWYVAECSDHLRWDSLVEGRITTHWLELVAPLLRRRSQHLLPPSWGRQFITRLHNVLHKQWINSNLFIHYKSKEGWLMHAPNPGYHQEG